MARSYFDRVPAIIDAEGSLVPDVPAGTDWVGATDGSTYLLMTPGQSVPNGRSRTPDRQVEVAAQAMSVPVRDPLDVWKIRGQ